MIKKLNIGIITADSNGAYPVPAVNGGAVSTLIETLIRDNSEKGIVNFTIFSFYTIEAYKASKKYKNVKFVWVKVPKIYKIMDKFFFYLIKKIKKVKAISYKSIFSLIYYIYYVSRHLKHYNFDKLILENNIPIAWIIRFSKYRGKYYYHFHNIPRINAGCRKVFEKCTAYLCVSNYLAKKISSPSSPIGPIDAQKIRVLYNTIDTDLFFVNPILDKKRLKFKYKIGLNDKVILFVGRLNKQKGIDAVINAVKLLYEKNIKLVIVGSLMYGTNVKDSYINNLRSKITEIPDKVIFTGYISQQDLPAMYNIADVVVLPSLWGEAAGLTMIEALSCGASVITTNCGGISEYVNNYATLLEVDDKLVKNIAKSISREIALSNDLELKEERHKYIRDNFSNKKYLYKFIKVLN